MLQGTRCLSVLLVLFTFPACSSPASGDTPAAPAKAAPEAKKEVALARAEAGLSAEELNQVLDQAKVDARHTCKGMARMRERVDVELTIAGSSGAVTHTNIGLDGGNPELASCVAKELSRVTFKPAQRVTRTTVTINF